MKKTLLFLLMLSLIFPLFSCGGRTPSSPSSVIDHTGSEVALPETIDRIAVCDIYPLPSVLAVFFDSAEKIVGIPAQSMSAAKNGLLGTLYPELLQAETGYIDGTNVNVEELMKLEPDIVFYSADNPAMKESLMNAGFAAVGISASNWEYDAIRTLEEWISLLSEIFPANDRTKEVTNYSKKIYDDVTKRTASLTDGQREDLFFLFQYGETNITTSGAHFFGQWWAEAIGARNVGSALQNDKSAAVNMEQVYAWNPSKIFITNYNAAQPGDLSGNTVGAYDWSGIDAVKNGEIYKMPLGMYRSYTCGADTPITLYWLAKAVYPDLFADIDITEETKNYYRSVFSITLTDEQAESIFRPVSAGSAY